MQEILLISLQTMYYLLNTNQVLKKTAADGILKNIRIAVPVKYLSNFWRSLEIPLINCKIHLELNWTKSCVMSDDSDTAFKITSTK